MCQLARAHPHPACPPTGCRKRPKWAACLDQRRCFPGLSPDTLFGAFSPVLEHRKGLIEPSRFAGRKLPPSAPTVGLPLEDAFGRQLSDLTGEQNSISAVSLNRLPAGLRGFCANPSRSNLWCKPYIL